MRRNVFLFALLALFPVFLCAQDVTVKRERTFTGAGLYGFMNGGADQFMEYGVTSLVARDVVFKGENYSIEIYDMPTSADAYGIYSIHVFKCQRADTAGCIDCLSPYQLQAVAGNTYVSVVFPSGTAAAQQAADELLRMYVPMEKDQAVVPRLIRDHTPYSGVVKYLRGPLSVSAASRALSVILKERVYTGVWFTEDKKERVFHALVYMADKEQLRALKAQLPADQILKTGEDYVYFVGQELDELEEDHGPFGF